MANYFLILCAFAFYFILLIGISFLFFKKQQSTKNFLLADRSLNYWVTALSAQTSDMGSWLFLAYPAMVYTLGIQEIWTAVGLIVFMGINWLIIAPALRQQTAQYGAETLTEFFEKKLNDNKYIAIISGVISVYFFVIYIASGLVGIGKIFNQAFDIPLFWGTIIGIAVTLIYSLIGGLLAISWSNLFQGIFLMLVIILVPAINFFNLPEGWQTILNAAANKQISMSINLKQISIFIKLLLGFGIGYFGQPHILINFMSIDDPKNLKKAAIVGIGWQTIVLSFAILVGLVGIPLIMQAQPEHLFIDLAQKIFNPFLVGLALCGIMAATLSTINTQLLVASSALSETFLSKYAPKYKLLNNTKIAMFIISLICVITANIYNDSLYHFVLYAWSGLGSAFGPALLLTLYLNNFDRKSAMAAMITGATVSGLWPLTSIDISPLIPGFTASLIVGMISSIIFKKIN
jgi:SSS family solute:Na+ symporter